MGLHHKPKCRTVHNRSKYVEVGRSAADMIDMDINVDGRMQKSEN
jgi:hypothetical protein